MDTSHIEKIYSDYFALMTYLEQNQQISFLATIGSTSSKFLLISAASFFESEICKIVKEFYVIKCQSDEKAVNFLENKAINRQYYTYFNWDGNNANSFFGLFGAVFKNEMTREVQQSTDLEMSIRAFLQLGQQRNIMAHKDLARHDIGMTLKEVYDLFQKALVFPIFLKQKLV